MSEAHLLYALAWLSFGLVHSTLAASGIKGRCSGAIRAAWRLAYNLLAVAHLGTVWLIGWYLLAGTEAYALEPWLWGLLKALYVAGWAILALGLSGYDLARLAGTRQIRSYLRGIDEPEDEPLRRDGLHRFVRHPVYAGGFLILWGRVDDPFALATAVWGSLYLVIGTVFEERRLSRLYGAAYAAYRRQVPAFVPWKGRVL